MKKVSYLLIFISILLTLIQYGCEYDPNGVYYKIFDASTEVGPITADSIFSKDTVFHYVRANFEYSNQLPYKFSVNKKILKVMFYQNESKLRTFFINEYGGRFKHSSSSINDSGFVEIYYQKDMIMVDKLVCKLNCATGLGNMTDLYNMDTIVKEKKMTLITIPESYLYLEEYQYGYVNFLPTNFQSIELKNLLFGGSYIVKNDIDTLAFAMDLNWIRIVDSTFFGEKSSYKAVSKIGGRYFSTYSKSIPRWETIPGYKLENIANDLYKITFTKTTFWNRIDTIFFNLYFENELVITHKLATKIDNSLVFSVNKIDLTKTTFSYYCKSNLCTYPQARIAVENKKIY